MTAFDPEKITFFAKTDARGKEVSFGIKAKDRQRHMYVVGKTGMGKSTLLENMAAQDIQNGEGMAFIDPHGSAAETLLQYVPEHRVKDVVYFAPFDMENPISFNVMEDVGAEKRHLVVSGLMSTFKKIWVDAWSARMEYILTNALLVLIEYPDTTLLSVNRLFSDKAYRTKVVDYCKDPAVKAFWVDEFANYTDRFTAEALPAIQNKIGQFTGNPLIRNIIGQPHSSFDIRKLMDEQKILIMNLSKGLVGETNANLLGSMLTTRIYLAAMSRADLPVEQMKQMPNFYFYVDEFQSFANATFANILSEARKYHLNLIIAHQYIEQMEEDVRNAVFGNVGTTIAFRVGPFDAEVLETVFAPRFEATDLVNLGFAQIYLTLMIDGIGSQPFSAKTLPPVQLPPVSCRDMVIASSRQTYAHRREEVEKLVQELHTPEQNDEPKRNFDRGGKSPFKGGGSNNKTTTGRGGGAAARSNGSGGSGGGRFTSNDTRPKPKPPEKTSDDLRQILAQMSGKDSDQPAEPKPEQKSEVPHRDEMSQSDTPKKAAVTERAQAPVEEKKDVATPQTKPVGQDMNKQPAQSTQAFASNKSASEVPHRDESEQDDVKVKSEKSFEKKKPVQSPSRSDAAPTEKASDLKSALADVLAQVKQKEAETAADEAVRESEVPTVREVAASSTSVAAVSPQQESRPAVAFTPRPVSRATQVRTVVLEHRRRQQMSTPPVVVAEKATVPAAADSAVDTGVTAAEVRRLLRQSENERSPFG